MAASVLTRRAMLGAGPVSRRALTVNRDAAVHAARRLTFGPTPELVAHIRDVGVGRFVAEQLRPQDIDDSSLELMLREDVVFSETLGTATEQLNGSRAVTELQRETLLRQAFSQRQLYEVVVSFFSTHLSIFAGHVLAGPYLFVHDRDVVRPHALGRFHDMLLASAKNGAMLVYLDNWLSDAENINENYGREILELHTVGVRGGYTEKDVRHAALALTGWTIETRKRTFLYRPEMHYVGALQVMGWRHPNRSPADGVAVGESLVSYLAHHPSTARHLATKLVRRFVADTPPASLVASAAKVYLANDTRIEPVLRHILGSRDFLTSYATKYLRPQEYVTAAIRALGLTLPAYGGVLNPGSALLTRLDAMGHSPFGWPPPDGYADVAGEWQSTAATLGRWNFAQALVAGQVEGFRPDYRALSGNATTAGDLVDRLAARVCFQPVSGGHRNVLLRYLALTASDPVTPQMIDQHGPQLVALLLSSPYCQYR